METSDVIWSKWIDRISDRGYNSLFSTLLDALKPLSLVLAQAIYFGSPILSPFIPSRSIIAAAELLEDRSALDHFCHQLGTGGINDPD